MSTCRPLPGPLVVRITRPSFLTRVPPLAQGLRPDGTGIALRPGTGSALLQGVWLTVKFVAIPVLGPRVQGRTMPGCWASLVQSSPHAVVSNDSRPPPSLHPRGAESLSLDLSGCFLIGETLWAGLLQGCEWIRPGGLSVCPAAGFRGDTVRLLMANTFPPVEGVICGVVNLRQYCFLLSLPLVLASAEDSESVIAGLL